MSGNVIEKVESRIFHDLQKGTVSTGEFDLEKLKNEPKLQDEYHEPLGRYDFTSVSKQSEVFQINRFYQTFQLDEKQTKCLVENCRANKTTIQGVISLACMISLLNEKENILELPEDKKVSILNPITVNLRYAFKDLNLSNEDVLFSFGMALWCQEFCLNDTIWKIAAEATKQAHNLRDTKAALKHWLKCNNSIIPQYGRVMQSSIGVVSLGEANLRNIKITDLRFFNSTYDQAATDAISILFVHTFLNRLTFGLANTYPKLSSEWAKNFLNNIQVVFTKLAGDDAFNMKVTDIAPFLTKFQH